MLFKDVENMARLQEDIVKTFKSMMIENEVCQCLTSYTQYNDSGSYLGGTIKCVQYRKKEKIHNSK
jgi:hypothetical protein